LYPTFFQPVLPKVRRFIEADLSHQHDLPFRLFPENNYKVSLVIKK
jgi:hypothetical protein